MPSPFQADGGSAAAGQSPAKPQTDHLAVNLQTGETTPAAKPVAIPKVAMQQPVTLLKATGSNAVGSTGKAVITYVDDGDTVRSDNPNLVCRIDGIDAPEVAHPTHGKPTGQPYGEESKATLQDMILKREVTVRISKPAVGTEKTRANNYGRDVCQIEISGKNVSTEMVRAGAAWVYTHFNTDPTLPTLQAEAKAAHRGLWRDSNPIDPRQMRNYGK